MKRYLPTLLIAMILVTSATIPESDRKPVDPVGFATKARQMDSVVARINRLEGQWIRDAWKKNHIDNSTEWKTVICPHDDYAYAGWLYPAVLSHIKAPVVIVLGVAHKAKKFGLEGKMLFDGFEKWKGPYGPVAVSSLRADIQRNLPAGSWLVHDSIHAAEHSVEALVPFLQYYNRKVEIVPILVPYMSFAMEDSLSLQLAGALGKVMKEKGLVWGRDVAIAISNDAVHYGDKEWGGENYAKFGCDSTGYRMALTHELEIVRTCLTGQPDREKMRKFSKYTVRDNDYHLYKWSWCGRYSVPFGILTSVHLAAGLSLAPLSGTILGYGTSIQQKPLPVDDLGMGVTAIAELHHWVGYAAVGYK